MRPMTIFAKPGKGFAATVAAFALPLSLLAINEAQASTPSETTIAAPADSTAKVTVTKQFSGSTPATGTADPLLCTPANCDTHTLHLTLPKTYWASHTGGVKVSIGWADDGVSDLDLYVLDKDGNQVAASAGSTNPEAVDLGPLAGGDYTIEVVSFAAQPALSYNGTITLTSQKSSAGMTLPENKNTLMNELTVHYPLRVIFVGRKPSAAEIAELKANIPTQYQPTVANVAGATNPTGDSVPDPAGAGGLINWNKVHYGSGQNPYFLGLRYKYDLQVLVATDAYAKALFNVAKQHTAKGVAFRDDAMTAQLTKYDQSYGSFRVAAKGGDPTYKVTDPSTHDLVDGVAVEDWMFKTRTSPQWKCAFKNAVTHECVSAKVLQNTTNSYHDPYYDKFGLNLDKMPEGVNKGSSYLFFDTFTPSYAKDYFTPGAYHVWGTDKVINGKIIDKPATEGGSWRITDPDTNQWAGVDFARTWGGRYRWHFFDLGAAPNNYEDITWANYGALESSDYPQGDPPVWQYDADPLWQQAGSCQVTGQTAYTGDTPCRMMPRLARDVAYGLFFRSTPGYLYRPIPQGDVYWLATTNFTDFYSRPQWVDGSPAPLGSPYGTWWTDMTKLFQIDSVTKKTHDDTLRWLSSAMPYVKWVGRKGQIIPLYNPKTGKKTGTLDTSPKYADLPAPEYHVSQSASGTDMLPEPLYGGHHVIKKNADGSTIDLTQFQNEIEKAKAAGLSGASYDDSVNTDIIRDYIDAHRIGMADRVPGVGTVPSLNMVFEKAYTWALPAIVGGIALADKNGNAWGVFNNVNDRFKACSSNYPVYDPTVNQSGDKVSLLPCHPKQQPGTGFSYTIEHEAAHNLGLSHPHDGSYGVDKCPAGDPNAGKWMCYWQGLGWVMDVSAAPTTYAMAYRPYEVEDQDSLQRGHIAEYLLGGQASLQKRLLLESKAGRSTPSAVFKARYSRYKALKAVAVKLFRAGDYLHAEYAARDAALAAKGVRQTGANTIDPRLVQAGQVFYFRVHPQSTRGISY